MTAIGLGVGCESQPIVLFGLARKPLLLFRHRRGVRAEKGQRVKSIMEYVIIQVSCLRLATDLPYLVEALQGEQAVRKVFVGNYKIRARRWLSRYDSVAFSYFPCPEYTLPKSRCAL